MILRWPWNIGLLDLDPINLWRQNSDKAIYEEVWLSGLDGLASLVVINDADIESLYVGSI